MLRERVKMIQKAGVMMGLQTVCLRGVNDNVEVMRELFMQAIEMGVRPYYVYSTNMVEGAHHFIVPHARMLALYEGLRGWIRGPAVPTFIVDGLGGLGKLPIIPSYVREEVRPDGQGTTIKIYLPRHFGEGILKVKTFLRNHPILGRQKKDYITFNYIRIIKEI